MLNNMIATQPTFFFPQPIVMRAPGGLHLDPCTGPRDHYVSHHHHHYFARPEGPMPGPCCLDIEVQGLQRLDGQQNDYLSQLQGKDQKLKETTERLLNMGFSKNTVQGIGGVASLGGPAGSTAWVRGNNGKTEVVYLSSDGTVTPQG